MLVAAGIALCAVLPVLTAALTQTTSDAALRRGLAALPPGERIVGVSFNGGLGTPAQAKQVERAVVSGLHRLASGPVRRQLQYRELSDGHGATFVLAAADDLGRRVSLVSGRLPSSCTPTRCEVVALRTGDDGAQPMPDQALGIVIVGAVTRTDPLLLAGTFDPGPGLQVLLAGDVDGADAVAPLSAFSRTHGWVVPLDLRAVQAVGVDRWVRTGSDVADTLNRVVVGLVLLTPDQVLTEQDARARASARRFWLLGAASAVLLLGTAVVGGAAVRRDHELFLAALRRRGASRRQLGGLVAGEVVLTAAFGAVIGLVLGGLAAGALAARAGLPVLTTAASAVVSTLPLVAVLAATAAGLLALTLVWNPPAGEVRGVWRLVDALAVGCLVVGVLLAARGAARATTLAGTGDPLVGALPVLVLVGAGLVLARVWVPLTRSAARHLPRRAVGVRLGLAAAGGQPLRPVVAAAVLTAAVATGVFAGAYGATLARGAADQAAFAVPLDVRLATGRTLEVPIAVRTPEEWQQAVPGTAAFPVLRLAGSVRTSITGSDAVQLTGLDPAVLARLARWSEVTGSSLGPATLARRLAAAGSAPTGLMLPTGAELPEGSQLRIATPGSTVTLAVDAWARAADGREQALPLRVTHPGGPDAALVADLSPLRRGPNTSTTWRLVGLDLRQPQDDASRRQHALGEAVRTLRVPEGRVAFGDVTVDGARLAAPWRGWGGVGLEPAGDGASARLDWRLDLGSVTLSAAADGPGTTSPLPVVTDPATAALAQAGRLSLVLDGAPVDTVVVGTLDRFPTIEGRFAVADGQALARLADRSTPGSGQPGEVWLAAPASAAGRAALAAAVSVPPVSRLAVTSRSVAQHRLATDPVARAASGLLVAGAALVLLVAAATIVLLVVTERQDDAPQLSSWEADGVSPATLRASLWWRAVSVAVPAVPAGVLTGVALSRLSARLVAVTATAQAPVPPLVPGTGVGWALLAVVVVLAAALALSGGLAWRSLREPMPVRAWGVHR